MEGILGRKLEAAVEAFSDERVRWLIGKKRELVASGIIDEKTLDSIIRTLIGDEIEIHLILSEIRQKGPLTSEEVAGATNLAGEKVGNHLKVLRFLNEVSVVKGREGEFLYGIHPTMEEERRRCPCEALIKLFYGSYSQK